LSNPLTNAVNAKGSIAALNRARLITRRYGPSPAKMARALTLFIETLRTFDCDATFPVTAVTVARHPAVLEKYQAQGIEFAIHGYTHVDYARLAAEEQSAHLRRARQVFERAGLAATGFRSPYLQGNADLYTALQAAGFAYVSNQSIMWDVVDMATAAPPARARYKRARAYYVPWDAAVRLSLPRFHGPLIEIPVCLPDDEMLLDRLDGQSRGLVVGAWQRILAHTYQRGELFTLQLHPERVGLCADALTAVLAEARALWPAVWCARLDEIAAWWAARDQAVIEIEEAGDDRFRLSVAGPTGTTVLVRGIAVDAPTTPWADGYVLVMAETFIGQAPVRPVVGLSPRSTALAEFLRQQSYLVETGSDPTRCACYFDRPDWAVGQERAILLEIETAQYPLIKIGRWPDGARSALAITGDVDALTIWDYGLRFLGH